MKTIHEISFFAILIVLLFGTTTCSDDKKGCKNMPEQIIGTGEIIHNAIVEISSFDNYNEPKEGHIITSDSLNIYNSVVSFDNRKTFIPIDFSQYTVLGKYADGGCRAVFDRNVTKNTEEEKYIYTITVIECGTCKELVLSTNWVLIPKIEDVFSVEFLINHERN